MSLSNASLRENVKVFGFVICFFLFFCLQVLSAYVCVGVRACVCVCVKDREWA